MTSEDDRTDGGAKPPTPLFATDHAVLAKPADEPEAAEPAATPEIPQPADPPATENTPVSENAAVTEDNAVTSAVAELPLPRRRRHRRDRPAAEDRFGLHLGWELLLAAAVVALTLLLHATDPNALRGDPLRDLLLATAATTLLATAVALSLRAAVPNLAAPATATTAGVLTVWLTTTQDLPLWQSLALATAAGAATGLASGLVVALLRAPAWAVAVGTIAALAAAADALAADSPALALPDPPDMYVWLPTALGVAVGLSALGGLLGARARLRSSVALYRPTRDPALARGARAGLVAIAALTASGALAAAAGCLLLLERGGARPNEVTAPGPLVTAFAVVLLGGTSARGRYAGVFGTVLAAGTVVAGQELLRLRGATDWQVLAAVAGALVVGLAVSRLVERFDPPPVPAEAPAETVPADSGYDDLDVYEPEWDWTPYPAAYEPEVSR